MSGLMYNLQFEKLCNTLSLGVQIRPPQELKGGLLNKMYAIETKRGKFAVKALNPQIMMRQTALNNYIHSERITQAAQNYVPALPAKSINGSFIHKIDSQYYLVFDWVEGVALYPEKIKPIHCHIIGKILGQIHEIDFSTLKIPRESLDDQILIDWNKYQSNELTKNASWINIFNENLDTLSSLNKSAILATQALSKDQIISHRDLDPKNVLWDKINPIIIDWEASGYIHPLQEMIETALYWSEDINEEIVRKKFTSFVTSYQNVRGMQEADWKTILASGLSGKFGWLEYNLKRSLLLECSDSEEQELGIQQVESTIKAILNYASRMPTIEAWLNEVTNL